MSTRCQIGFFAEKPRDMGDFTALIYKHSDGYPEGVLPILEPFLREWNAGRGLDDAEYAAARFLQHITNACDERMDKLEKETGTKMERGTLGYGICRDFHGDIEYFYYIYPSAIEVYETSYDATPDQWKLIKTIQLSAGK